RARRLGRGDLRGRGRGPGCLRPSATSVSRPLRALVSRSLRFASKFAAAPTVSARWRALVSDSNKHTQGLAHCSYLQRAKLATYQGAKLLTYQRAQRPTSLPPMPATSPPAHPINKKLTPPASQLAFHIPSTL